MIIYHKVLANQYNSQWGGSMSTKDEKNPDDFSDMAEAPQTGIVREFWDFIRYNKKWWLTPIVVVLLLVGVLVLLSGTTAAPFIYTLF